MLVCDNSVVHQTPLPVRAACHETPAALRPCYPTDTLVQDFGAEATGPCHALSANSDPIPFESELFKGVVAIYIRHLPTTPAHLFQGKKRLAWVALQVCNTAPEWRGTHSIAGCIRMQEFYTACSVNLVITISNGCYHYRYYHFKMHARKQTILYTRISERALHTSMPACLLPAHVSCARPCGRFQAVL